MDAWLRSAWQIGEVWMPHFAGSIQHDGWGLCDQLNTKKTKKAFHAGNAFMVSAKDDSS